MKKRIVVTQKDIDHTPKSGTCDCMVARAIKRAIKPGTYINIGYRSIVIGNLQDYLPDNISQKIRDRYPNKTVNIKPFNFNLDIPSDILR